MTFLFGDKLWTAASTGMFPLWLAALPTVSFTAFVVVYAIDRWFLVKRSHYPLGRALFQIAFALVFLSTLLPDQASEYKQARTQRQHIRSPSELLYHKDPSVRAASCELLGLQNATEALSALSTLSRTDPSSEVRTICQEAENRLKALKTSPLKTPAP